MMNSGHISGWAVKSDEDFEKVYAALEQLKKQGTDSDGNVFMFAVGDGNHSLATAKAVWDEYKQELISKGKSEQEINSSPVRYALVELVNIYDEGLTFEPIHRVMFNADAGKVISFIQKKLGGKIVELEDSKSLDEKVKKSSSTFGFVFMDGKKNRFVSLETSLDFLAVATIQPLLDEFVSGEKKDGNEIEMDYIHGSEEVFRLGKKENAVTFLLPPIEKDSFFATINGRGPLPRKSFSMGEASEKRFYLECRKLFEQN